MLGGRSLKRYFFKIGFLDGPELPLWRSMHRDGLESGCEMFISLLSPFQCDADGLQILPNVIKLGKVLSAHGAFPKPPKELVVECLEANRFWGTKFNTEESVNSLYAGYTSQIALLGPEAILIWNRHQVACRILVYISRLFGIPFLIVERSAWPLLLTVDREDSLLRTSAYRQLLKLQNGGLPDCTDLAETYVSRVLSSVTWWEQPKDDRIGSLREELGLTRETKIVLFAIQVDSDVQNLLYNPSFSDCADALRALVLQLESYEDLYIVAKHHPKSPVSKEVYDQILGSKGRCLADLSLERAFRESNYVVGVNSALLFEASLSKLPVMAMGQTMLSGCSVFYEYSVESPSESIRCWLEKGPFETNERFYQHLRCLNYLLKNHFIFCGDCDEIAGLRRSQEIFDLIQCYLQEDRVNSSGNNHIVWEHIVTSLEHLSTPRTHSLNQRIRKRIRKFFERKPETGKSSN